MKNKNKQKIRKLKLKLKNKKKYFFLKKHTNQENTTTCWKRQRERENGWMAACVETKYKIRSMHNIKITKMI